MYFSKPKIDKTPFHKRKVGPDFIDPSKVINPASHYEYLKKEFPNQPVYHGNQIMNARCRSERGPKTFRSKIYEFGEWFNKQRKRGIPYPKFKYLRYHSNPKQILNDILFAYGEYRFAKTNNQGDSIKSDFAAIRYYASLHGVFTSNDENPWVKKFSSGCDNTIRTDFKREVKTQKSPIFTPILEALLKVDFIKDDPNLYLAFLIAQRMVLRSEHYVKTRGKNCVPLKIGNLHFHTTMSGKLYAMSIKTKIDKNHPNTREMARTAYCTCHRKIACLPCMAYEFVNKKLKNGATKNTYLIEKDGNVMNYQYLLDRLKLAIVVIGCNPDFYGTHSFRAGGASELFFEGWTDRQIQYYGWWKVVDSIDCYIRPNNPDIDKFINIPFNEYIEWRRSHPMYKKSPLYEKYLFKSFKVILNFKIHN